MQQESNREKRRQLLVANWDPSYPEEKVNWYQDFIQRHAEQKISWFQEAELEIGEGNEQGFMKEATGASILFDDDGLADKLVRPDR